MNPEKPTRPRRSRKRAEPLTTPNPVELALQSVVGSDSGDAIAHRVLRRHEQLIGWQIVNERASMALRVLTGVAGVVAALVLGMLVVSAARSQAVVVEAFGAPPEMIARGYTGQALASALQDELLRIQSATRSNMAARSIANAWSGSINVEVPTTGVSIGEIDRVLRQKLGRDTHIGGDLTQGADGTLTLTVRGDGITPRSFSGPQDQLPALVRQAAEHAYGEAEPALFAHHLYQTRRFEESLEIVRRSLARGPDDASRARLLNTWGNLLWVEIRYDEAIARYEAALAVQPSYWGAWRNLVGVTSECCGDEAGLAVTRRMRAAIEAAPAKDRPSQDYFDAEYGLTADPTTAVAVLREEDRKRAGGMLFTTTGPRLAQLEMARHDWRAAREALAGGDPSDPQLERVSLIVSAVEQVEAGRPALALPRLRQLIDVQSAEDIGESGEILCLLALTYAQNLERDVALRTLARSRDTTACRAREGAIHEALGDRGAADAAARRSIGAAPSSPYPYEARGRILLARGDLNGAGWRFDQAHARGPRWADPIKGQGDVLAARGRWREAAAKYQEALAFAPGWIDLRQALVRAERGGR